MPHCHIYLQHKQEGRDAIEYIHKLHIGLGLFFLIVLLVNAPIIGQCRSQYLAEYKNPRFNNENLNYCFYYQETNVSCIPASVKMVLSYLGVYPIPNQSELAIEMHTDLNHTTKWSNIHMPFEKRGFNNCLAQTFTNFNDALSNLKERVSNNFPVIVETWYDGNAKEKGTVTHARVITGFNSTGVFFHDPWYGLPYKGRVFLNNLLFSSLWKTGSGYWAFIIEHEPKFDISIRLIDLLGLPISHVNVTLTYEVELTSITNSEGIAEFLDLPLNDYKLFVRWRIETIEDYFTLSDNTTHNYSFFFSDSVILVIIAVVAVFLVIIAYTTRD
jgi:predicted double-glycine peptidase